MRFKLVRESEKEPPNYRDWKQWFAWRPVIFDNTFVWLEMLDRSPSGMYPPSLFFRPYYYRLWKPIPLTCEKCGAETVHYCGMACVDMCPNCDRL